MKMVENIKSWKIKLVTNNCMFIVDIRNSSHHISRFVFHIQVIRHKTTITCFVDLQARKLKHIFGACRLMLFALLPIPLFIHRNISFYFCQSHLGHVEPAVIRANQDMTHNECPILLVTSE